MLKIGNVVLPGNLVLSPMAGVSDAPFRAIARMCGADYTISEMLTSQIELWNSKKSKFRIEDPFIPPALPKILQIVGATPEILTMAAIKCQELGADIIEINMGCPAKKVCNVLAGSTLLKDEILVDKILASITSAVKVPITLKTRLGFCHNSKNILNIAKIAENNGVAALTIHGRTRADLYNGEASYELIAKVKNAIAIPVFANGDITDARKALKVLDYTKADGLYIGRAALGRPWLFKQIKDVLNNPLAIPSDEVSLAMFKEVITTHINYIYQHYPEVLAKGFATKHFKYYLKNLNLDKIQYEQLFLPFVQAKDQLRQLDIVNCWSPNAWCNCK